MKKIKMITAMLFALVLIMGLLTACGEEEKTTAPAATSKAPATSEAPATDESAAPTTDAAVTTEDAVTETAPDTAADTAADTEQAGSKHVTITVVNAAGEEQVYDVYTDAEYLRGAMDDAEGLTYEGDDSDYGIYIKVVNGETADYNVDGSYWGFYINGDYCNFGCDTQPVADGDAFSIEYTK